MSRTREQANVEALTALFDAWRSGKTGYEDFLAERCVYETAGFPVLVGRDAVCEFLFGGGIEQVAQRYENPRLTTVRRLDAEVLHLVASGPIVFSERIDHHYDADGNEVFAPRLAGVMEFDDEARCVAWRDYHDPAYFSVIAPPRWASGGATALAPAPA